jgi:1,4-dihydroxy-2-naphthoate polyprenyltransferase
MGNRLNAWRLAARVPTLVAAVVPVAVGMACASRTEAVSWMATGAALIGAVWLQIGTNLANDVADFERGADASDRLGPVRAAQAGLLTPSELRRGVVVAFAVAVACGGVLIAIRGWPIVAIGLSSMVAGLAYTAGPFPLAYNGLGEVFVLLFFGWMAVCGTAFAAGGSVPAIAWWAAVPVGASATMLLVVNNVRDRFSDARAAKRTLVVRHGRTFGELEYLALAAAIYLVPIAIVALGLAGVGTLLAFLTAPMPLRLLARLRREDGAALNGVLKDTARFLLVHGLWWSVILACA